LHPVEAFHRFFDRICRGKAAGKSSGRSVNQNLANLHCKDRAMDLSDSPLVDVQLSLRRLAAEALRRAD